MKVIIQGIYRLTNTLNGMQYIGSSINLQWRKESYRYKNGLPAAIKVNNVDCEHIKFEIMAIYIGLSRRELVKKELDHIIKHKTIFPMGYNISNPATSKPLSIDTGYLRSERIKQTKPLYQNIEPIGIKVWPGVPIKHIIFNPNRNL